MTPEFMQEVDEAIGLDDLERLQELVQAHPACVCEPCDEDGSLPVVKAADKPAILKFLLANGADPSARGAEGDTPLIVACREGRLQAVQLLLTAGVDVGVDVNAANDHACSALWYAVRGEEAERLRIVQALLAAGARVNEPGGLLTPLIMAVQRASEAIVQALLDAGADINAQTQLGTALTAAIEKDRSEMVELLLARGADVNQEWEGLKPIDLAQEQKLKRIVAILSQAESQPPAAAKKSPVQKSPAKKSPVKKSRRKK